MMPIFTEALLLWLERTYPDRCPTEKMSDREVWIAAGAAKVIRCMRAEYERRQSNILEE